MKIECVLRRPGGTTVNIGGIDYSFAPDARGRHVAEVTQPEHIRAFASIEGYRLITDPAPQPTTTEAVMSISDDRFVAAVQAHKDIIQKLLDANKSLAAQVTTLTESAAAADAYKDQVSAFLEAATAQIVASAFTPAAAPEVAPAPEPTAN